MLSIIILYYNMSGPFNVFNIFDLVWPLRDFGLVRKDRKWSSLGFYRVGGWGNIYNVYDVYIIYNLSITEVYYVKSNYDVRESRE